MKLSQTVLLLASATTISAIPVEKRSSTIYFFSFGDSYTTTGFDINGVQPAAGNPMGNPPLGTTLNPPQQGTYTGGINYVGLLATKYNSTDVSSYNFAEAGSCIDNTVPGCNYDGYPTFQQQVTQLFEPRYTVNSPWKTWNGNNSIFSMFFGINDIAKTLANSNGNPGDKDTVCQQLIDDYLSLADNLYSQGARRFLIFSVPPIDRTPYIQTMNSSTIATYASWVETFNYLLGQSIPKWQSSNEKTGISVSTYDIWSFMTAVLDEPQAYGFPDATCMNADGQSCIWWNIFHYSARFNQLMAARMVPAMNALGFNGSNPKTGYYER